jgi:hypothetical protein
MYTSINFKTKKKLKEAVKNGTVTLEGPHYPEPHRWYAQAELKEGVIVKVKA